MQYLLANTFVSDYDLSRDLLDYLKEKNVVRLSDLKNFLTDNHPIPGFKGEWLLEIIELFKGFHKQILIQEAMLNLN